MSIRRRRLRRSSTLFGAIKPKKLPAHPKMNLAPPKAASFTLDTDRPNATQMVAMRLPGLDSPDFPALEVLADVLSSHRFDLYGLVPPGKALERRLLARSAAQAALAYAAVSFPAGGDAKAAGSRNPRHPGARWPGTACRPIWSQPAKIQEQRATEFQKNSHRGPGLGLVRRGGALRPAFARRGSAAHREGDRRRRQSRGAQISRSRSRRRRGDDAAGLRPAGRVRQRASAGRKPSRWAKPSRPKLPDWAETALGRLAVPPSTLHPVVSTLPNGLTLIVQPEDVSDTVSVYGHIRNRPEIEAPPGKDGVAQCSSSSSPTAANSSTGSPSRRRSTRSAPAKAPARISPSRCCRRDFDRGVELLADNELHPALPQTAMDIVQRQIAQVVEARNKSPGYLASARATRGALFPKDDPALRDATPEIDRGSHARRCASPITARRFRPDLTTIVVIGHVTPEKARADHRKIFRRVERERSEAATSICRRRRRTVPHTIAVPDASRVQDNVDPRPEHGAQRAPIPTTTRWSSAMPCSAAGSIRRG